MPSELRAASVTSGDDLAALRAACVKVTCDDGTVGTGYFVSTDQVVTCEHVVRRVKKDGQVILTLFDGSSHEARLERLDASTDVALLRLPQGAPSVTPLRLKADTERKRPFEAMGFPEDFRGHHLLLTGYVHDPVGLDPRGASAIVLYSDMVAAGQGALMHGYSGSPVVVEGMVVGHLKRVLIDDAAGRLSAEKGMIFATPGREVLRFLKGDAQPAPAVGPVQVPGAAYNPQWYVPRLECEQRALAYLEGPGSPAVLHGPWESGKSWLLSHLVSAWRQRWPQGAVARVDFQEFDRLATLEDLTGQLAYKLMQELEGEESWLATYERGQRMGSAMTLLGTMLKKHVLGGGPPVLLVIDSADAIQSHEYASSFFAGLRAWMDNPSHPWDRLRVMMAISTTPSQLIKDINKSPFNLKDPVKLAPLSVEDVRQLALWHGLQPTDQESAGLHELTGGHPYLVRRVLFEAAMPGAGRRALTLDPQAEVFEPHLRKLRHFVKTQSLEALLKTVLRDPATVVSPDQEDLLKKAWLVRRTAADRLEPTCTLHREFLAREFGGGSAR